MGTIDKKTRKILYALDYDARQSLSSIASYAKVSKQVLSYRFPTIQKSYVFKFLTLIDIASLGMMVNKAYFRFQNTTETKEQEIINYLKNHLSVAWLTSCEGRFDFAVAFHTHTLLELDEVLTHLENKYGHYFAERVVNSVIKTKFFPRDYLVERKDRLHRKKVLFSTLPKPANVDDTALKILSALARDARASPESIAQQTNITTDAVRKRIRILEAQRIIHNYVLVPNANNLGITHYKILIKLRDFNQEMEKSFESFCEHTPSIFFMNKGLGAWEMEIDLEVEKRIEFQNVMRELKDNFASIIKEINVITIYQIYKFDFLPMYVSI